MPAVVPISTVPVFAATDDPRSFSGSTPASFSDIPPVLRHKQENVAITFDPPHPHFNPQDTNNGTLYILTSVLVFMSSTGKGFQIQYPLITLHAISRAEASPSIYCQLDESDTQTIPAQMDDQDADMRELSIIPQSSAALEPIFEALSICASLHPDKEDVSEGDLEDACLASEDTFDSFEGDEEQEFSEVGRAALAHLESIIENTFQRD